MHYADGSCLLHMPAAELITCGTCSIAALANQHRKLVWFRVGNPLINAEYKISCKCGWRSDWERHEYAAERALRTHIEDATGVARPDLAPT